MRKVTAAVMASTLAFSAFSRAAVAIIGDNASSQEGIAQHSSQSHMFDGISLTNISVNRCGSDAEGTTIGPLLMLAKMETMHRLVTAENFDENAVRAQAEKWHRSRLPAVEMAKVRNQMFHLLSPSSSKRF